MHSTANEARHAASRLGLGMACVAATEQERGSSKANGFYATHLQQRARNGRQCI